MDGAVRLVIDCELQRRLVEPAAGGERWSGVHRSGIPVLLTRWIAVGGARSRLEAWLARRARLAHAGLAPLVAHGAVDDDLWAAVAAREPHVAGADWRAALGALSEACQGIGALHAGALCAGDPRHALVLDDHGRARFALPLRPPDAERDAAADLADCLLFARALLPAAGAAWSLPAAVRALLAPSAPPPGDGSALAAALREVARHRRPASGRRLAIACVAAADGLALLVEDADGRAATREIPAATVAELVAAARAARAARPATARARRALGAADPVPALAARFAEQVLPPAIAAQLWQSDWRIAIADAGSGLPWRLIGGVADATRGDVRVGFADGDGDDVGAVAPVGIVLARGPAPGALAASSSAARAWARFPWWRTRGVPSCGALLIVGDREAARAWLAADATRAARICLALVAGDGPPLELDPAAAQIAVDAALPRSCARAVLGAAWRALRLGQAAHDAVHAADRVLAAVAAPCEPLLAGLRLHGNADLRLSAQRGLPLISA